jgi:NADPH:quinone reductase-like Zn-dependent oxidoreductase
MKALVLKASGQASSSASGPVESYLELKMIDVPKPHRGQVLVKVSMASVNPSDVIFIKGYQGRDRIKGRPAGAEGTGVVVATGGGVAADELMGKRVGFYSVSTLWGAWAEYAVVDTSFCVPLADAIKETDAAAMIVNPLTALGILDIVREVGVKSYVLAGGGSQILKFVISAGSEDGYEAISLVRLHYQIPRLKTAGAAHVLNTQAPDYERALRELIATEKPKVLLDAITGPLSSNIFPLMPEQSKWVVYGQLDTSTTTINEPSQLILQGKQIQGFYLPAWIKSANKKQRAAVEAGAQGRFLDGRWTTDVTAIVPMADALDRLSSELVKPDGKVFIQV